MSPLLGRKQLILNQAKVAKIWAPSSQTRVPNIIQMIVYDYKQSKSILKTL